MKRLLCIAACTILMVACCSGLGFSQMGSGDPEMQRQFFDDLQTNQAEMDQFGKSVQELVVEMQKNIQTKAMSEIPKRMANMSEPMTPELGMRFGMEIAMDEMVALQPKLNDKAQESLSAEKWQKMRTRMFQMKLGLMDRLDSTDNSEVLQGAFGLNAFQLMAGQPDFLELTPEQKELILKQQKESSLESMILVTEANMKKFTESPEKVEQLRKLGEEYQKAETEEEREQIAKKMQEFNNDTMKDVAPRLKKILRESHDNFMRALTDAQRAKIKAVMADMPDYLKKRFAELDKNGGTLGGLDSWVPGMGAPGGANPNREAPRQRSSGRAFPGE